MHSLSSREKTHCTLVLHMCSRPCTIALLALRSMAPFGWLNFSLPSLSHPTLSRVLVSHPEETARFSRPILDIGNYDLLTVIGSCFWLISQTQCLTLNVAKAHMSNLIPRELFPIRHQLGRLTVELAMEGWVDDSEIAVVDWEMNFCLCCNRYSASWSTGSPSSLWEPWTTLSYLAN